MIDGKIVASFVGMGPTLKRPYAIGADHNEARDGLLEILKMERKLDGYDPNSLFYGFIALTNGVYSVVNRKRALVIAKCANQLITPSASMELSSQLINLRDEKYRLIQKNFLELHANDF